MTSQVFKLHLACLLVSILLTAVNSTAAPSCLDLFTLPNLIVKQSQGDFGKSPNFELDRSIYDFGLRDKLVYSGHEDGIFSVSVIKLEFLQGTAYTYYRDIPHSDAIVLDMIIVPENLRGLGISTQLFEQILIRVPNKNRLVFFLDLTNKEIFNKLTTHDLKERLANTPAYKSLSKLGFSHIEHISITYVNGEPFPQVILSRNNKNNLEP